MHKNKALKGVVREMAEIAGYLWQRGWAERNAGNISVNITDVMQLSTIKAADNPFYDLQTAYSELSDSIFVVTGTGRRMRELARKPMQNALIIKLNTKANGYWILSQKTGTEPFMPTSELPAHLGIHQMIASRGSAEKVVMHAHATELIALTHASEFCQQEALNKLLWGMHPETMVFVPKGIGFVPYCLPGTSDIAAETVKALQDHDVALWEKHGVFAIGKSMTDTFDVIDILAKSARIFFMCRSAHIEPGVFTDKQLLDLKGQSGNF